MSPPIILVVSTYAPRHCGVATYALQTVNALKQGGAIVHVLSPPDGDGTYRAPLRGYCNILRVALFCRKYDRIIIQYAHPDYYYGTMPQKAFNVLTSLSFIFLFAICRKIELVVHEPPQFTNPLQRRILQPILWKLAPHVVFHTATEQHAVEEQCKIKFAKSRVAVVSHHRHFQRFCSLSKREARRQLGISRDPTVFLCIGFVQESKGFDRAARAFADCSPSGALLYIVGSTRRPDDADAIKHLQELTEIAQNAPGIQVINKFPGNEEFDMWIIASDYVMLPYRDISSSSVLARAHLLGRPVIVADVGGLRDQIAADDMVVDSDENLMTIIKQLSSPSRQRQLPGQPGTDSSKQSA